MTSPLANLQVIGVDPGGTCGFAVLTGGTNFWLEDLEFNAALDRLEELTYGQQLRTVIAVERFTPTGRAAMTAQTEALEFIGAARFVARKTHALRFLVTGASDAQRMAPPSVLRELGWWSAGGDHLNKAAAQVAYAVATLFPEEFARLSGV